MNEDLMKSLDELNKMLKGMNLEKPISPHVQKEEEPFEENNDGIDYCIKNGAYVRVSEDGMQAWIYLNPPKEGEGFYTKAQIMEFLSQNKVIHGIHTSNIAAIAKKHIYGREILAAVGTQPREGVDGYFEFLFNTVDKRKPRIREDGTVDYSAASQLSNVSKGDKVCIYHRPVIHQNGHTVRGNILQCNPAKDLKPLKCKGCTYDEKSGVYYASTDGKIDYRDNTLSVQTVHVVSNDINLITGKVEFYGDINISGNVGAGVIIKAGRDVIIDGVVESVTIVAGGNVTLKKGIQGGQKATIVAKGSVMADFVEHCVIDAGGDVRANSFVNAYVNAKGMVKAEGKNGIIIGGTVRGLKGVSAICIGNESEVKTTVGCGYTSEEYAKYVEAYQNEIEYQKNLAAVVDKMTAILKNRQLGKASINTEKEDNELLELNDRKDEFFAKLDSARTEKEKLSQVIENGKGADICANEKIFRGVSICIEGTVYKVPENTCFMKYTNEDGRIVSSVIAVK